MTAAPPRTQPDIVERLRSACDGHPHAKIEWPHRILHEAADEIERLRAAPAQPAGMREAIARTICEASGEYWWQTDSMKNKDNQKWIKAADAILTLPAERPAVAPNIEAVIEAVTETVRFEWGSVLCYRDPVDGTRDCGSRRGCRCKDIACAVVDGHCAGVAQGSRPRDFLAWAVKIFGPVAKLRSERLLRFCEEAIELAHAEGMEREVLNRVADRVYSRPAGNVGKEIGQAQACLETFAENIGLSSDAEAQREWERVQEIPQDEWTRRHSTKQALGIALPSTEGK